MGLDDLLISTGVDSLIKLVHDRKKIEIKDAAGELGVPLTSIEDWAHTLEEEGLIKLEYKLTHVFLIWSSMSNEQYEDNTDRIEKKKKEAISKLEGLKGTVDESIHEIDKMGTNLSDLKEKNKHDLDTLAKDVVEAQNLSERAQEIIEQKKKSLLSINDELDRFENDVKSFEEFIKKSEAANSGTTKKDGKQLLKNFEIASDRLDKKIAESAKNYERLNKQIEELHTEVSEDKSREELEELKGTLSDLRFSRDELAKTAKTLLEEVENFDSQIEHVGERIKDIEKRKSRYKNPETIAKELEKVSDTARKQSEAVMYELQNNLMVVRKQIEEYTQAQYQYQNITAHMNSLRQQYSREGADVNSLIKTLDDAQKKYIKDLETIQKSLGEQQTEYKNLTEKAKRIDMILNNIKSLKAEGENLSSRLRSLIKEAEIVKMAAPAEYRARNTSTTSLNQKSGTVESLVSGQIGSEFDSLPPELVQKINLTREEEQAFERKREELRWLIHKMWEEDRSSGASSGSF